MTKLVIIDGNAIMHRAFHALPPLTTPLGEPVGAVQGFLNMLLRILEDLEPTHLAVCFDRKEPTFRKSMSEDYQSHRPEMDDQLSPQFPLIQKALKAMNIPIYDKAGYEADDLIGTIASKSKADNVVIVTGDRDILQLVNNKVQVYLPVKGLSIAILMKPADVKEKLGVSPDQIVDYKALVGDPSDNYKGVPGIGPKTAIQLLSQYQNLENIYKNLDNIKPAIAEKLKLGKKSALLSQNLAQIMLNVPFKFDLADSAKFEINSDAALEILSGEYGFKTIPRRIQTLAKKIQAKSQTSLF